MTLQSKISLTYISLIVVAIVLVSTMTSWQLRKYVEQKTVESLEDRLDGISALFSSGRLRVDSSAANDEDLTALARRMKVRLTVIREDGAVIFDSDVRRDSLGHLENHGHRPEILSAMAGHVGVDRRRSASVEEEFIYAAEEISVRDSPSERKEYVRLALRLTNVQELDSRIQATVWVVGVTAILLALLPGVQISRRITRPIQEMADTAHRIKNGDLEQRIPVEPGNSEISNLSRAINDMAATLSSDIAQLRKLERVRTEFLGNVSHELRTPIFSVQGFIETLLDGAIEDPNVNREFLEKAHRQTIRLNSLLNDLIEISRIESGDMKLSFRFIDVIDLVDETLEDLMEAAGKKNIVLEFARECPPGSRVYGDKERLKQVISNLVDNAIKYTEPGGRVVVRAAMAAGGVTLSVEDTGVGIEPNHIARIFERFYRVDRDRSREVGGTGLGLAIVKHIVEAHGSRVEVASEPGKGSRFTFLLKS